MLRFAWDLAKARANLRKHGVAFEEAIHVFYDPDALFDQDRSVEGERRWQAIGLSGGCVLLLVAHTVREVRKDEVIRIISARRAERKEWQRYGENRSQDID